MKYIVKVLTGGSKTATYLDDEGKVCYYEFKQGRNLVGEEIWNKVKDSPFIKRKLRHDEMTVSEHTEDVVAPASVKDGIDLSIAEGYVGKEDGKDLLAEYAGKFGYKLKKNMNIDNMLKDLKAQVEG